MNPTESEILKAVKDNLRHQNDDWKFVMGRESLTKEQMLKRLDKDKAFRKTVVNLVVNLSIDILSRQGT